MGFFPFFFIDAGHALCGVVFEDDAELFSNFDDAVNAAAIAMPLRGSKRAFV